MRVRIWFKVIMCAITLNDSYSLLQTWGLLWFKIKFKNNNTPPIRNQIPEENSKRTMCKCHLFPEITPTHPTHTHVSMIGRSSRDLDHKIPQHNPDSQMQFHMCSQTSLFLGYLGAAQIAQHTLNAAETICSFSKWWKLTFATLVASISRRKLAKRG